MWPCQSFRPVCAVATTTSEVHVADVANVVAVKQLPQGNTSAMVPFNALAYVVYARGHTFRNHFGVNSAGNIAYDLWPYPRTDGHTSYLDMRIRSTQLPFGVPTTIMHAVKRTASPYNDFQFQILNVAVSPSGNGVALIGTSILEGNVGQYHDRLWIWVLYAGRGPNPGAPLHPHQHYVNLSPTRARSGTVALSDTGQVRPRSAHIGSTRPITEPGIRRCAKNDIP